MKTAFGKTAFGTIVALTAGLGFASSADGRPRRRGPPRETSARSQTSAFAEDQSCLSAFRDAEASEQAGRLRAAKERARGRSDTSARYATARSTRTSPRWCWWSRTIRAHRNPTSRWRSTASR